MYFVINAFIATICIITLILFTEVFPKLIKALISLIAIGTSSYAITILIRKIAEVSSWYKKPAIFPTFYYVLAGCAIVALIATIIVNKKSKAK